MMLLFLQILAFASNGRLKIDVFAVSLFFLDTKGTVCDCTVALVRAGQHQVWTVPW